MHNSRRIIVILALVLSGCGSPDSVQNGTFADDLPPSGSEPPGTRAPITGDVSPSDDVSTDASNDVSTDAPDDVSTDVHEDNLDSVTEADTPEDAEGPVPFSCDAVQEHEDWELCASGPDFCEVLFEDSAGCAAVCDALGLVCHAVWENVNKTCAPDTSLAPLACDPGSGHQSDYCICRDPSSTCTPDCSNKNCGADGCGGSCGTCEGGSTCVGSQCACAPASCESELLHCGGSYDDGCGGTFSCTGTCPPGLPCEQGYCGGPPAPCTSDDCPAFPGAEGEGMHSVGGRGGDVCHVTNLKDSGSGSLRACTSGQSGPRTVVFDVAGRIQLKSSLQFTKNKLTVAGQTAPGDGIVISGYGALFSADDIIVQHLRFRTGDSKAPDCPGGGNGFTEDCVTLKGSRIIVDHVSASWGIDENLSGGNAFKDMTIQYSIIAEGLWQTGLWHGECNDLYEPGGDKGHSMGGLYKPSQGDGDISIHHNLFAHNGNRNPAVGTYDDDQTFRADIRNNVIYNCPSMGYTSGASEKVQVNYVGNYGIFGPSSSSDDLFKGNEDNNLKLYRDDNRLDKDKDGKFDGIDHGSSMFGGDFDSTSSPFTFKPVTTHDSSDVPDIVLAWAGARPWSRDEPDERVIEDVEDNKGSLVDTPEEAGGYGELDAGTPVTDSDGDGMPDDFEAAYGTNPQSADNNGDIDGDGYTNLENYLHWAARPR